MRRFLYLSFRFLYAVKTWVLRRFTRGGLLVLGGIFISAMLGLDTRRSMAYQIFTFLCCLQALALVWSLFFRIRLTASRVLPKLGTAGERVTYQMVLRNHSAKPESGLYLIENPEDPRPDFETFLKTPEPGESRRNLFDRVMRFYRWEWLIARKQMARIAPKALPTLRPGGTETFRVELMLLRRGVLRFTGLTVARPDPFGLFYAFVRIPLPDSLIVLPRRYPLPAIRLPGNRRYQAGGVALTSSVGDSEEFVSLRDYRPGDPLRKIHWKSWAKTGRPVVKEFQEEFFVRHALVLDTFQMAEYSKSFEEAVSVAASFACTVQTQDSLLDLIFVGPRAYCFTSGRGLGQTEGTLEVLASVRPCRDKPFSTLAASVTERADSLSGCICVLLAWDEERKQFIARLRALGLLVLVLVITASRMGREGEAAADPGPLSDVPEMFHQLEVGKIEEGLARL